MDMLKNLFKCRIEKFVILVRGDKIGGRQQVGDKDCTRPCFNFCISQGNVLFYKKIKSVF